MAHQPTGRTRIRPENDIYTVLAAIAVAVAAGTIAFVIYRCTELFGTAFPGFTG